MSERPGGLRGSIRGRKSELSYKHGMSKSRLYFIWRAMKNRCYSPCNKEFKNYGKRGIRVAKRWLNFLNFKKDMGERPPGKSLDRINNNGNYTKRNCKWSTPKEQAKNRRYVTYAGSNNIKAKLNPLQVLIIRAAKGILSGPRIARIYNINDKTVYRIWRGQTYKES
jgi:ribosomal protein S8